MKFETWWPVALGFAAGAMVGSAVLLADLAWHQSHDHPPPYTPPPADLVGRWEGTETFGTTFVVTRQPDGSFTETRDSGHSNAPTHPPVITSQGRYAANGLGYSFYYTGSDDASWPNRPPKVFVLYDCTPTELKYMIDDGNGCRELKK